MAKDVWKPGQYERFHEERAQPFRDLLAGVERRAGLRVVDLGCGTGEHTASLHAELLPASTLGIDRSEAMLDRSHPYAASGLRFERCPIEDFAPERPFDLVFSNAALHWLPDHRALLGRIQAWVAPGGQLAVQVPANHEHASQTVAAEVAGEEPFRSALDGFQRVSPVLTPAGYEDALAALGFEGVRVEPRVYPHTLGEPADVIEWVKGTTLTDYERRLSPEVYAAFLERYRERLLAVLPDERPFRFPFRRILFWASCAG
ncbi:MAG: methyltransferase domain-containing protein [Planctomycetota bacterium]